MDAYRAIENLIASYAERIDLGDFDGVAELLAHAVVGAEGDGRGARGRDQVLALYRSTTRRFEDGTPRTKHVTTNVWIEVDDASGTARSRSYFTVLQATAGLALQPIVAGRYHDRFERAEAGWRFSERRFSVDLVGDVSRHLLHG